MKTSKIYMKTSKIYEVYEVDDYGRKRVAILLTAKSTIEYIKANLIYDSDSESAVNRINHHEWASTEKTLNYKDITKYTFYNDRHSRGSYYIDGFEVDEIKVLP